jgi:hypothetical protein
MAPERTLILLLLQPLHPVLDLRCDFRETFNVLISTERGLNVRVLAVSQRRMYDAAYIGCNPTLYWEMRYVVKSLLIDSNVTKCKSFMLYQVGTLHEHRRHI